jgi:hypothetical protein
MPLVNTQSELNHDGDLMEFIFLFCLNQSFQFKLIDTISEITRPDEIYPAGPHIVISIDNISLLILNHPSFSGQFAHTLQCAWAEICLVI